MRQKIEFIGILGVSTLLHLALFQGPSKGASPAAGDFGDAAITLTGGNAALSALVAEWERPVEAAQQVALPEPPAPVHDPAPPSDAPPRSEPRHQAAMMPLPVTPAVRDDLPAVDTQVLPPSASAVTTSLRPPEHAARPQRDRAEPEGTRAAQPRQVAAGTGRNRAAGHEGPVASPAEKQAAQPSLMAHWGNQIRAAVERRKHYPAGTRSRGTVVLSIAVSTGGVLSSVAVTRSTGDRLLDQAALSAVKRARFARAPGGIPHGVHRFSLPVTFAP